MSRSKHIPRIGELIHSLAPDAEVILFGSQARGDARSDSDIDLLILVDQETLTYDDITRITYPLYDYEVDHQVLINPLVYTKYQWEHRPFVTPFYRNVMSEGVKI